jgi:cytidylate kinase
MQVKPTNPIVIAIDGPSGTGKSTTASILAKKLNIRYIDTGAMYRAITLKALNHNINPNDEVALIRLTQNTTLDFSEHNTILIDGVDCGDEIRTPRVSANVSHYCQLASVRQILTQKQREMGERYSCVLDGRDIGTIVFPNADFKFFLTADYKVRAERRLAELMAKGIKSDLAEVEQNLRERDHLDQTREVAPLRKAADAIEIDTTHTSIPQQVESIYSRVGVVTHL